jgi:hypothetical protein
MKPSAEAKIAAISTNLRRDCGQNVSAGRELASGMAAASLGDFMEPA